MTLCSFLWIAAMACSTDAIPTAPSGPEQNQLVSTISIDPSDAVIQPDDREILKAQIRGARGQIVNGRDITWTTSDPSIIDIDASGNIFAANEGTATITARHKTVAGSATVDVRGNVIEILFNDVPDLVEGQAGAVNVTYRYSNGATRTAQRLKWWSEDREIARVDGDGELLGIGEGSVNIYAAGRGRTTSQRVRVGKKDVAGVVVLAPETDIEVGERRELWAEVYTAAGDRLYRKLAWSSSNTSVATVDRYGGVTGIKPGTATITATVAGVRGSADVTIVSSLSSGSTGGSDGGSGSSGQSVPTDVTDLAVVDTGLNYVTLSFTRVDDGTGSDAKYEFRFGVAQDFDWSRAQVAVKGNCDDLSTGTPGQKVTCHIEGLLAATDYRVQLVPYRVSGSGTIYGELSNVANGRTDDPGTVVDVVPSAFSMDVGQTKQLNATVTDAYGNPLSQNVTWSSTSSGVASVTSSGTVNANAAGSATIRATAGTTSSSSAATIMQPAAEDGGGSGTSPAPGQGWNPQGTVICDEDFTRFSDWNAFMAGAGCISNKTRLDSWGRNNVNVETGPLGVGTTGRGLWYRFRALPTQCSDQIVGQANVPLPAGTSEVWIEWDATFSSNFETSNPNCSSPAPDYKYVLVWFDKNQNNISCGVGRSELKMGTKGSQVHASTAGYPACDDAPINGTVQVPGARQYFDGRSHHYRLAFRMLGNGKYHVFASIDGNVTHDYVTNTIRDALAFDRIMLGSNRNVGATSDMFLNWETMKVWTR